MLHGDDDYLEPHHGDLLNLPVQFPGHGGGATSSGQEYNFDYFYPLRQSQRQHIARAQLGVRFVRGLAIDAHRTLFYHGLRHRAGFAEAREYQKLIQPQPACLRLAQLNA